MVVASRGSIEGGAGGPTVGSTVEGGGMAAYGWNMGCQGQGVWQLVRGASTSEGKVRSRDGEHR